MSNETNDRQKKELILKLEQELKKQEPLFHEGDYLLSNWEHCEILKQLGFDEPVNHVYHFTQLHTQRGKACNWNDWDENMYSCPTYKQALKWLKKD